MPADLSNVKIIVNDMVSREAKFGSYLASKEKLQQTYKIKRENFDTIEDYYDENGNCVASADANIGTITDYTGLVPCTYNTSGPYGDDKFKSIDFWVGSLHCTIESSNHNGKIDGEDKIKITDCESKTKTEKTISVFLEK